MMKKDMLFPNSYRLFGWIVFIPSFILGLIYMYGDFLSAYPEFYKNLSALLVNGGLMNSFTDEIAAVGVIAGLILIAFSREKIEDEMIRNMRLESLQWSIYVNYLLLALAILFVYDSAFFSILIYNMFTILLVFIVRFRWFIHKMNQGEEVAI